MFDKDPEDKSLTEVIRYNLDLLYDKFQDNDLEGYEVVDERLDSIIEEMEESDWRDIEWDELYW